MLQYNIELTGKHVSYSWDGNEFTNEFYSKCAKLDAQSIPYTTSVKYMQFQVEVTYDFYEDIEPAEIFVDEELAEWLDDEEDDFDGTEYHFFETQLEAKEFVASEVEDFYNFETIRGLTIVVRHADTEQILYCWNKVKELV